jgi:hypothetical protein
VTVDAGMAAIAAAWADGAPQPPDGGAGAGAQVDVLVRLAAGIEANTAARRDGRSQRSWANLHPIQLPPDQTAAAGTVQHPDTWGPRTGWIWRIELIAVTFAVGTTQASIYRDSPILTNLLLQMGTGFLFEPKRLILKPEDQLVVVSVGNGVTVRIEGVEANIGCPEAVAAVIA